MDQRIAEYKIKQVSNITTPKWIKEAPKWYSDWSTCTVLDTPEPKLMHLTDKKLTTLAIREGPEKVPTLAKKYEVTGS